MEPDAEVSELIVIGFGSYEQFSDLVAQWLPNSPQIHANEWHLLLGKEPIFSFKISENCLQLLNWIMGSETLAFDLNRWRCTWAETERPAIHNLCLRQEKYGSLFTPNTLSFITLTNQLEGNEFMCTG